ncbi:MAG TPA: response regulator transcription factor [Bryobacteraceae bacterium]|jgi:two-component system NarL family response regulator
MYPLSQSKIRVLVVDDHPLVRRGLEHTLASEPDIEMVGEAGDGKEGVEKFLECHPDVVLMDLRMPKVDGIEASRLLRQLDPEVRIIVLTSYDGDQDIYRALEAGIRGYILKEMAHEEVGNAIRAVYSGKRLVPAEVAERLSQHFPKVALTPREVEVLGHVARGMSNKEIAFNLSTATGTIKMHLQNILRKLGTSDRTQAVTIAIERGILHLDCLGRRMAATAETARILQSSSS